MTCELQGPQLFTGLANHYNGTTIRNIKELHFEVILFIKTPDHISMHTNIQKKKIINWMSFQLGKFGSGRKSQMCTINVFVKKTQKKQKTTVISNSKNI